MYRKNYADHAAEMDSVVPTEPIIFIKPNTAVTGPNETIMWPKMSERVDHEAELAIVISRICKEVPAEKATDVIFGYTLANDVTARDLQKKMVNGPEPKVLTLSAHLVHGSKQNLFRVIRK